MNKVLILLGLLLSCTMAVQLRSHNAGWEELDVDNLDDDAADLDEFIRDAIDELDGDLD